MIKGIRIRFHDYDSDCAGGGSICLGYDINLAKGKD